MEIRKANNEDGESILRLQKICYMENAERYNDYNIPPMNEKIDELIGFIQKETVLVCVDEEIIVGSIRSEVKGNTCYIGRVIVHPDFQNKGIGSKLMYEMENINNNIERYELFTGFKDSKNLYLYKKLGYNEIRKEVVNDKLTFIYLEKRKNPTTAST